VVGYNVLRKGFGVTVNDKVMHRVTSQYMTELGDPLSAAVIGELREIGAEDKKDSADDRRANYEGIRAGIRNQLGPIARLLDITARSNSRGSGRAPSNSKQEVPRKDSSYTPQPNDEVRTRRARK
jgi:hypothetical protein